MLEAFADSLRRITLENLLQVQRNTEARKKFLAKNKHTHELTIAWTDGCLKAIELELLKRRDSAFSSYAIYKHERGYIVKRWHVMAGHDAPVLDNNYHVSLATTEDLAEQREIFISQGLYAIGASEEDKQNNILETWI